MASVKAAINDLLHIFFPHVCAGCGDDVIGKDALLCVQCLEMLPLTNFYQHAENQAEKIFRGRVPVTAAGSFLYFSKDSLVQRLLHQLKYKGNAALGYVLGRMMGQALKESHLFETVDALVPLPLHPSKEKKRGYNQAMVLCSGLSDAMGIPVCSTAVAKIHYTDTQTHKSRVERWQNMEGGFVLVQPELVCNKHVLLIDDVLTTGATLEACAHEVLRAPGARVSIATLAYTVK